MRTPLASLLLWLIPIHGFHQPLAVLQATQPPWAKPKHRPTSFLQSSVSSFQNDTISLPAQKQEQQKQRIDLVTRSAVAGFSCVTTWAMTAFSRNQLSIVQASSLQGIIAGLFLPAPLATASFCGSFAGMSGQIATVTEASILGAVCGAVLYRFEKQKWQLGKGGRLGTVAFLANSLYYITSVAGPQRFVVDALSIVRPGTAVAVLASACFLARQKLSRTGKALAIKENQATAAETANKKDSFISLLRVTSKAVLLGASLTRLVANSAASVAATLVNYLGSAVTVFVSSLVVKKTTPIRGVVLATSVVGLLGSFLPVVSPAAVYLGAFLGMTGLAQFQWVQFGQSSLLSAALLELGLWNGFGGKLGFLSFLGVHFGL